MKKFILKSFLYLLLILLALEIFVRVFHLYTEDPPRFIDELGVEKRVPGSSGHSVTGNRNQNYSEFEINEFGFNSRREFNPSGDIYEVAIIGDSFIEGFHQDITQSIGAKIEKELPGVIVYKLGYAGYDLANQFHLIYAYKEQFRLIDKIIIYLNFENDLNRKVYEPNHQRIKLLSSSLFKIRDNIKLLSYSSKIGALETVKNLFTNTKKKEAKVGFKTNKMLPDPEELAKRNLQRLNNFKNLKGLYGIDRTKTAILLDSRKTSDEFLKYCQEEGIEIIDFADTFSNADRPTTLIYDWHWNDYGRSLIAGEIVTFIKNGAGRTPK